MTKDSRFSPRAKLIIKSVVIVIIVAVTFVVFGWYLHGHPELLRTLTALDPLTLVLLAIGYCLFTLANAFALYYELRFIRKHVPLVDNIILTGYSSIVNFFGPLQSGPGFRAAYLKKKYGVRLRDFFAATLIFYGFYALINGAIIAVASLVRFASPEFYFIMAGVILGLCCIAYLCVTRIARLRDAIRAIHLHDHNLWLIGVGALLLTLVMTATYFVEIHHVNPHVSIIQTLIYTAAANLSLFVSLTPGAIGFRESFLLLSQQLHGIDTSTIVGASVIDRAFYVGFLLVLFVVLLAVNSRKHLAIFRFKPRK